MSPLAPRRHPFLSPAADRAKKCPCHLRPEGLSYKGIRAPYAGADIMWRHAAEMESKIREMGLEWPRFEHNEMVDLITFIERETQPR
jgi:hypothetical protein